MPAGHKSRPQGGILRCDGGNACPQGTNHARRAGFCGATEETRARRAQITPAGFDTRRPPSDVQTTGFTSVTNLRSGSTCEAMKRALFLIFSLMSGHGIGAGNKRRSHQTGSPCPICDGSFKATDPDVGYRQETSDDSQVYSGRTTDLPRHMASVHGLKASSEYALHVESASLKRQPSLFSFMRRAAAPPQNIQEASSGSAGGDRGEEHGTLSEDGGGDEQMSDEETILPDSPRSGRFDISNFTVLLTKAVAPVLDLLATVNGTIKSLPLRVAEEVVKLQEKVKTSRSLADKALAKCGTAQEIGRCSTFKVSPDEYSLLCMPCIQQKKTTLSSGQFHLKGENMTRFGVVKLQDVFGVKPREFKHVKQAVKEHLQTSGHTMCLEAFHGEDMHRNKVHRAGLAVARSALKQNDKRGKVVPLF